MGRQRAYRSRTAREKSYPVAQVLSATGSLHSRTPNGTQQLTRYVTASRRGRRWAAVGRTQLVIKMSTDTTTPRRLHPEYANLNLQRPRRGVQLLRVFCARCHVSIYTPRLGGSRSHSEA